VELIAANVPVGVVKDFLGHATVATTENYYVNSKPAMRAADNVWLENTDQQSAEPPKGEP
jgi:integrase